ncbi:MAG: helix-turn-helix domain-containing protein [Thaumarchaeota archaeon]|nr:helix-turn-helix domain-containing protein [Nitrososphaerota archaeon]
MTVYEIAYKLQHDCPYNDLSRSLPDITFAHWCNRERDVIEITWEDDEFSAFEDLQRALRDFERRLSTKIVRKSFGGTSAQLVMQSCHCAGIKRAVSPLIEKYNSLAMQPIFYKHGWEWYRILAFRQKDIRGLFSELAEFTNAQIISRRTIEGTSVREAFMISPTSLLGDLTKKQAFALTTALARGYYEIPKKVSTDEMATSLKLPRTTFEEHLRKAESKVMKAVAPLLEMGSFNASTNGNVKPRLEQFLPQIAK